ncbi:hypothetical protein EHS39_32935 [Ensifer sp. MPMI2T]|nr:hypothetical protein EHS39_32935 [Ensifer sp. MPMI2T]
MTAAFDAYKNEDGIYALPPGIYFGLPENIYHAVDALGSTSIKELAKKPCKWQYDRLRPRKEIESEFLIWGSAWHARVLEGKAAFDERYAKPPRPQDVPGCLNTTDEIKDFLRMHGQKLTGNKPDLIARAKDIDDCPPIFEEVLAAWRADHPDYVELTDRQVIEIEDAVANMQRDPALSAVMQAGSLMNGAAEMSIICEIDGVRRKGRYDYSLAPAGKRTRSLVVDLKSFTTFKGGNDEEAAARKVYDEAYDVQAAYYMDLYVEARKLLAAGKVFGQSPGPDYIKSFLHADGVDWVWVMMRRDAGMVPLILSIDTDDKMFDHAKKIVADAIETYRFYMDLYGPGQLWTPPPKVPLRLNYSVMPTYNRGIQYEQPNNR